ncbi:hypothetical protein ACN46H_14130 [Glaesserella parasuis]
MPTPNVAADPKTILANCAVLKELVVSVDISAALSVVTKDA